MEQFKPLREKGYWIATQNVPLEITYRYFSHSELATNFDTGQRLFDIFYQFYLE